MLTSSAQAFSRPFWPADPPFKHDGPAVRHWRALSLAQTVRQTSDRSCGAAALATLLNLHRARHEYGEARILILAFGDRAGRRFSFEDMHRVARLTGYRAVAHRLPFADLKQLRVPAIVQIRSHGNRHCVVLAGIETHTGGWIVLDPAHGRRIVAETVLEALMIEDVRGRANLFLVYPEAGTPADFERAADPRYAGLDTHLPGVYAH